MTRDERIPYLLPRRALEYRDEERDDVEDKVHHDQGLDKPVLRASMVWDEEDYVLQQD